MNRYPYNPPEPLNYQNRDTRHDTRVPARLRPALDPGPRTALLLVDGAVGGAAGCLGFEPLDRPLLLPRRSRVVVDERLQVGVGLGLGWVRV